MINIEECFSLKSFNTFGIKAYTRFYAEADNREDLQTILNVFKDYTQPKLILGGGSNLLFVNDFDGITIYPGLKGAEVVTQDEEYVWIKVYAGENWDKFVEASVTRNWGGVENLSYIPGNVGACPIQNIGAYGVEVKDVIDSIEVIDLTTGESRNFSNKECEFGYRDSIFKREARGKYLVVSVTFRLTKNPVLSVNYKDVQEELKNYNSVNVSSVRNAIISIRKRKLPDPQEYGNAGSFFKNPVIDKAHFESLKATYPEIPSYPVSETEVKVPAAWFIEKTGWKGKREGNTGTHPNQPLVLVNYGDATGMEIYTFARKIQESVQEKFHVFLEMEVWIIE
jgi:UDP-N-acetylmuramate dehydrogenase